ncbi:MAG TPA: GAF domain-containing protein [Candidatus Sulfomarinibacteraceae bacterium]|nr:GAF domain-containing protein [Candidatus Sulfomarinibacteraceae bacterium]
MDERHSEIMTRSSSRDADRLQSLYAVNDMLKQIVADGLEIDIVLPRVLRVATEEVEAAAGSVIVIDERLQPQHAWIFRDGVLKVDDDPIIEDVVRRGLFAWVTRNQCTAIVEDTREDERWLPSPDSATAEEPWSVICAPLIIRNRTVGAFTMSRPGVRQFNEEAVDLLNAIANQAASTIESARLYEESQRRAAELASLVSATTAISSNLDLDVAFERVTTQLARFVDVDACALFDWRPDSHQLVSQLVHPSTMAPPADIALQPRAHPTLHKAIERLAPAQVRGQQIDENSPLHQIVRDAPIKTALFLPLAAHDHLIALAILVTVQSERRFSQAELNLLQMLANQAAVAIENAKLYEDTQRQLKVSALLNEASKVINSSLDTNQILQSLLAQMNELLNAEAISIALVDKGANELVYEVAEGIGSDKILGLRLPSNQGVSGWVMEHGKPALVQDTRRDERFFSGADRRTGHDTRALLCAPLQVKGEVLGTIQAINPRQGTFSDDDLQLLVNLANLASSALANAQQFARTQAAEARYMSLFEDSVNPILLTDQSGTIVEANRRALNFLGYEREELLGLPIFSLHPEREVRELVPRLETIGLHEAQRFTAKILTSAQKQIPVEGYAKRTVSGDNELLQWIYRDISQQVELEEMREDLMAMLVHDLQSPLGNVISSLELMRYELPPDGDPILDSIVDIASRSSRRLQTLIRSLLDITHLEAGHSITEAEFVEIDLLIEDAQEIVQPALERRHVTLQIDMAEDLPEVYVDSDMISRVFINLLDNASKYTPETRKIIVKVEPGRKEAKLLVSISDQGTGIAPQYRKVIFDKFRRLQGKNAPKGMGLGLAFCRLAVEAHEGEIWVDDAPGGGARFNFTLPTERFSHEDETPADK